MIGAAEAKIASDCGIIIIICGSLKTGGRGDWRARYDAKSLHTHYCGYDRNPEPKFKIFRPSMSIVTDSLKLCSSNLAKILRLTSSSRRTCWSTMP